jgi:hypothetical protein
MTTRDKPVPRPANVNLDGVVDFIERNGPTPVNAVGRRLIARKFRAPNSLIERLLGVGFCRGFFIMDENGFLRVRSRLTSGPDAADVIGD